MNFIFRLCLAGFSPRPVLACQLNSQLLGRICLLLLVFTFIPFYFVSAPFFCSGLTVVFYVRGICHLETALITRQRLMRPRRNLALKVASQFQGNPTQVRMLE